MSTRAPDWSSRAAGVVLIAVGSLNVLVGVLAFTTGLVRISVGAAGGYVGTGFLLVAVGALVWRGNRSATISAFAVVLTLLLLQVGQVALDPPDAATQAATGEEYAGRIAVLALLVVTTGAAAWHRRRAAPAVTSAP